MRIPSLLFCAALTLLHPLKAGAVCSVQGTDPAARDDVLQRLFNASDTCPGQVQALRAALQASGYGLMTTLVANRGTHHPSSDSFSFFEGVEGAGHHGSAARGEVLFGHFTELDAQGRLGLAQRPDDGALMVELLAWDGRKRVYNYYELRGDGTQGRWFYRGDSNDIAADIAGLFVDSPVRFGARLRCSGCHVGGGPILKELSAPHNDWWRPERPLPFTAPLAPEVRALVASLQDAEVLSQAVQAGVQQLAAQRPPPEDLRQALRPLFCPQELNLESDAAPSDAAEPLQIGSAFWADPRLASRAFRIDRAAYAAALEEVGSRFPETPRQDADHAFLAPVKAWSDTALLDPALARLGLDEEFVADVLAVDFTRPLYSPARCGLLASLPRTAAGDWQATWHARLAAQADQGDKAASTLLDHLTNPLQDRAAHQARAAAFLDAWAQRLQTADAGTLAETLRLLAARRAEVSTLEISQNPRGQILEPGFRLIFPESAGTPADLGHAPIARLPVSRPGL